MIDVFTHARTAKDKKTTHTHRWRLQASFDATAVCCCDKAQVEEIVMLCGTLRRAKG